MRMLASTLLACLIVILTACGGGPQAGSPTSPTSSGSLSGNWQMVLQLNPTSAKAESGFILQSGQSLTGGLVISGRTLCAGLGSADGKLDGSNVAITVNQIAQTVALTGVVTSDGSSISGDYSILASGCGATQVGTWTASRVKPLNGNYTGTFTSGQNNGLVYDVAATVAQGPNTGTSTATLSGTMTSTNAPCFSTFTISGLIGGTSVVFNLLASDGTAVGLYRPTAALDATTLTGVYQINAQPHVCSGDFGTATMTLQ
jgi:hypothetical protein